MSDHVAGRPRAAVLPAIAAGASSPAEHPRTAHAILARS